MAKNSKFNAWALIPALLGLMGLLIWLRSGVVQGQTDYPPTPLPPTDDGIVVPPCCDDEALLYPTPEPAQMTLEAQLTQQALETQQTSPTVDPYIPDVGPITREQYLPSSGELIKYIDTLYGYSVEYPANWFIYQGSNWTTITNFPMEYVEKSTDIPDRFRMDIYQLESLGSSSSLESYVENVEDPNKLISQVSGTLANGYQFVRLERWAATPSTLLIVYLTHEGRVYGLVGPSLNSLHIGVADHILNSFVIP